ncbi:MAG: hypothetical protein ACOYJS_04480 [Acutalibacteraceae bacterium]|jgi:hypothetical protein
MARIRKNIALLLVSALLIGVLQFSFSWFIRPINFNVPNDIGASTEVSYFESGNGSAEKPYVISDRVHVYNLAWLQYLGYFNLGESINNGRAQSYFVLKNDIDMQGLAIPPIGTEEFPFLGNFNGQGYTISNCITANSNELLEIRPSLAKFNVNDLVSAYADDNDEVATVIGFFGVIGDYNGAANQLLSKVNEGTLGEFDIDEVTAKNFYLNNLSVNTAAGNTTVGVAAGYVDAVLEGIGVCNSRIVLPSAGATPLTENMSDFTLVGYCTDKAKTTLKVSTVTLTVPKTSTEEWVYEGSDGVESGWGGSLDMYSLYSRLQSIRGSYATTDNNYVYDRYVEVGVDGTTNILSESTHAFNTYRDPDIGSFVFATTSDNSFTYLHGGTTIFETKYSYGNNATAYFITDGNGRYLTVDGTDITSTTNSSSAAKWFFSNGQNGGYISTVTAGFQYYLININGSLYLSRTADTVWRVSNGAISSAGYYLNYNNGWRLSAASYAYISNGNGNFLILNSNGTLGNTTNIALATVWTFQDAAGTGRISAQIGSTTYYLRYSSGLATTSNQNQATSWTNLNGNFHYNGNFIRFYNNNWTTGTINSYYISDGKGNYLSLSGTTLFNATAKGKATAWTFSNGISGGNITSGGRILRYSSGLTTSTYGSTNWSVENSTYIRYNNYYIKFNNGNWSASSDSNANAVLFVFPANDYTALISQGDALSLSQTAAPTVVESSRTYIDSSGPNVTYFPLQVSDSDYKVMPKNTGYIMSGSKDRTTTSSSGYPDKSGDIRVSRYSRSGNMGTSYITSAGKINNILTVNDSGARVNIAGSTAYEKLDKAKANFEAVLTQNPSNLYGLHFMNAYVSMDNIITVPKAVINNTTYTNYQMPTDCIDFRLKEKGYINFFAGTYFPSNNSFFTLYDIFRDENNIITDIKRITEIYANDSKPNYSYVYKYEDDSYSEAYMIHEDQKIPLSYEGDYPAGYTLKFRLSWIENNDNLQDDALYYFEVPVNDGEYALGSAEGCIGSYLLYLDIGANAQTVERTSISETITTTTEEYSFAKGVGVVENTLNIDGSTSVTENDAIAFILPAGSSGTLLLTRSGNAVAASGINGIRRFIANGLTLNSFTTATPDSSDTVVEKRLTYVDYNVITEETYVTVISQVGNNTPTMVVTDPDGNTSTEPYRKTLLRTDSPDDINQYYNPSTVTLLKYTFTVHADSQISIIYQTEYEGTQGYLINVLLRNMIVWTDEETTATILVTNFIEDSGAGDNHLDTTEVEIVFMYTG